MSELLQEALNILAAIGLVTVSAAVVALLFEWLRYSNRIREKRMAIRNYAGRVGRLLRTRYGLQETYTPAQVKGMLKEWGYSTRCDRYGLAMYCSRADFVDYHRAVGESCNYEALRSEISRYLLLADTTFSMFDVIKADARLNQRKRRNRSGEHYESSGSGFYDGGYYNDGCGGYDGGGDSGGCE